MIDGHVEAEKNVLLVARTGSTRKDGFRFDPVPFFSPCSGCGEWFEEEELNACFCPECVEVEYRKMMKAEGLWGFG
jgi:Zn finger protein HypA/HybF involved in hydrogenase expression